MDSIKVNGNEKQGYTITLDGQVIGRVKKIEQVAWAVEQYKANQAIKAAKDKLPRKFVGWVEVVVRRPYIVEAMHTMEAENKMAAGEGHMADLDERVIDVLGVSEVVEYSPLLEQSLTGDDEEL